MTHRKFVVGDAVRIVGVDHRGRSIDLEAVVEKVGRRFVHVRHGSITEQYTLADGRPSEWWIQTRVLTAREYSDWSRRHRAVRRLQLLGLTADAESPIWRLPSAALEQIADIIGSYLPSTTTHIAS